MPHWDSIESLRWHRDMAGIIIPIKRGTLVQMENDNTNIQKGKYAIIRPNSQTGHSPSNRYETYKEAINAAKVLCEQSTTSAEYQVVKIVANVSSKPLVRVIVVR